MVILNAEVGLVSQNVTLSYDRNYLTYPVTERLDGGDVIKTANSNCFWSLTFFAI